MEVKCYLGMDVSKLWVDITLLHMVAHQKQAMISGHFNNDAAGIKALHQWLCKHKVSFDHNSLLVIENTGVYHRLVWEFCSVHGLPLYIGNATHIKHSLGIARGKSDKVDSERLCRYGFRHADELKTTPVLNPVFLKLKDLMTARSRLLAQKNSIKAYLGELKLSNSKETQRIMEQAHHAALRGLKESLQMVEKQIAQILKEDAAIRKNYDLLLSVPGIGHVTAIYMICCTNNFIGKLSGKQLASYAGVAPFGHSSGKSIRGRDRVHKMANKDLKKLLHMGAISAITYHAEFKAYYQRKVKEGKHAQSVINAVRSKIALRAVAVINKGEKYVDKYNKAA